MMPETCTINTRRAQKKNSLKVISVIEIAC